MKKKALQHTLPATYQPLTYLDQHDCNTGRSKGADWRSLGQHKLRGVVILLDNIERYGGLGLTPQPSVGGYYIVRELRFT